MTKLTKEQAAVIGAYTGFCAGPFADIHEYAERKLGRPLWTHQFADEKLTAELREAAKADFIAMSFEREPTIVPAPLGARKGTL